jgi:hypothetical protein
MKEQKMKRSFVLGAALAAALSLPSFAAEKSNAVESVHHRHHHHVVTRRVEENAIAPSATAQVPWLIPAFMSPNVAPYANGQGDEDGLSRNIDDCNKGCIGGNPD